jgi:hypothetical protein
VFGSIGSTVTLKLPELVCATAGPRKNQTPSVMERSNIYESKILEIGRQKLEAKMRGHTIATQEAPKVEEVKRAKCDIREIRENIPF